MNATPFISPIQLRWSDMDPNGHLRHSVYYEFGVQGRIEMLQQLGFDLQWMQEHHTGPVLLREECIFRREVRIDHIVNLHTWLQKSRTDMSRWTFRHELIREDGTLCAVLTVDGAWIDTQLRKLTVPPGVTQEILAAIPRTEDFEWI